MRIDVGSVLRPCAGENVCGDSFAVHHDETSLLVAVADGLGHGPAAHAASSAFISFVAENSRMALSDMMSEASKAISETRGVAASLARIDFERRLLHYCGVGNCHMHSVASVRMHPVSAPGIVGRRVRKMLPFAFEMPDTGMFAICSDGISSRVRLESLAHLGPQEVADELLGSHGKDHDDVTAVVVRYGTE
jgi:phosphoserine phosphatase RsbX